MEKWIISLVTICLLLVGAAIVPAGAVTLPYSESFGYQDGSNPPDWLEWRGDWEVQNGQYTTRDGIGWWHFALLDTSLSDFVMEYDQTGIYSGGAILRFQDPPDWGKVLILQTFPGNVAFMNIMGQQFDPHPWSGPVDPSESIHVTIQVQGGVFDATAVASGGATWTGHWDSGASSIYSSGFVGFATERDDGSQSWDNVVIRAIPEPGSMLTLLCGLGGFAGFVCRRRR